MSAERTGGVEGSSFVPGWASFAGCSTAFGSERTSGVATEGGEGFGIESILRGPPSDGGIASAFADGSFFGGPGSMDLDGTTLSGVDAESLLLV